MTPSTESSTMSPRQQFQNSVRQLGSEEGPCHKRNRSIHLQYNPYELQHSSSLRVSPLPRRSPYRASPTSLKQVAEEPDFGSEERSVWSRRSPPSGLASSRILQPDAAAPAISRNDSRDKLPSFQPQTVSHPDGDERPKTRRGPTGPSAFAIVAGEDDASRKEQDTQSRKPKFVEGSMTSRSSALSSTWSESEYATSSSEAEETDTDVTPKADRKRRSGSFDLRDFQPPALTPSAIKRTLFGKRETKKDKKPQEPAIQKDGKEVDESKRPRRRLRKSMSKLHSLGEKMRMFGPSSHDLPDLPNQPKLDDTQTMQNEKRVLDERKRKADTAYAEQFGFKRHRDNAGSANAMSNVDSDEQKESHGNQKYDSTTVRRRTGTVRSRRVSTGSIFDEHDQKPPVEVGQHDIRKRPSRRELEKENQQLRALLRDSKAPIDLPTEEEMIAHALNCEPLPPVPPLKIRRKYAIASDHPSSSQSVAMSSDVEADTVVPPLPPQHPDRRILSNISNSTANSRRSRTSRSSLPVAVDLHALFEEETATATTRSKNPLQNAPKLNPSSATKLSAPSKSNQVPSCLPRSVSMIVEEPENEVVAEKKRSLRPRNPSKITNGKENLASMVTVPKGADPTGAKTGEQWQWPDDVF